MNTPFPAAQDPLLNTILYAISLCTDDHPALEGLDMAYNAFLMSQPADQQDAIIDYAERYLNGTLDYSDLAGN